MINIKNINTKYIVFFILPLFLIFVNTIRAYSSGHEPSSRIYVIALVTIAAYLFKEGGVINPIVKRAIVFVALMACYALVYIPLSSLVTYLPSIVIWVYIMYAAANTKLSDTDFKAIGYLVAIAANLCAYYYIVLSAAREFSTLAYADLVSSYNTIYYVVLLLPFIFLINNRIRTVLFLILPLAAIIMSEKTTALLAFGAVILFYFYDQIRKSKSVIILGIVAGIIFVYTLNRISSYSILMTSVFEDIGTGGNGRTEIAGQMLATFFGTSNPFNIIFGFGTDGVVKAFKIGAHNDFLEVLFNFGIIGFSFYLAFWWKLLRYTKCFDNGSRYKKIYIITLMVFFTCSIASKMLETQVQMIPPALLLGLLINKNRELT